MNNSAQEILTGYLISRNLAGGVGSTIPKNRPRSFITIERTGGNRNQFLDAPTFAIQAWEQTNHAASALADKIVDALPGILELEQVMDISESRVYSWPDPDTRSPRYQIIVSIRITT